MKASIGDVIVWRGEPPDGNPYYRRAFATGPFSLMGDERAAALAKFALDVDTSEYTFWHAPFSGGARKISAAEVNWESSGLPDSYATDTVRCTLCGAMPGVECRGKTKYVAHMARLDALRRHFTPVEER